MTTKRKWTGGRWYAARSSDGKWTDVHSRGGKSALCEPVFTVPHDDITEDGEVEVAANLALLMASGRMFEALSAILADPDARRHLTPAQIADGEAALTQAQP